MNKQTEMRGQISKIVIAGAGPAGASLAIRLANEGFSVTLIEREKFPRHKLCGEFVSPECLPHFRDLGVLDEMFAASDARIAETVFYAPNGKSIGVASKWFGGEFENALGISRAEMDFRLLTKARSAGVTVLEETQVAGLLPGGGRIGGVKAKTRDGGIVEIFADLTIDATGRAGVLGKLAGKTAAKNVTVAKRGAPARVRRQPPLVGFKAHLRNVSLAPRRCEIYFFRGGYGGLNYVENGTANHCFLVTAEIVKEFDGQAAAVVENVIFRNRRAFETMSRAENVYDWLAVSVEKFGLQDLSPAPDLLSVGDAAAFIDPFTGSGMLMALESAELLSGVICARRKSANDIAADFRRAHHAKFSRRLRVCALLRRAAFLPHLANVAVSLLGSSALAGKFLARATRQPNARRAKL